MWLKDSSIGRKFVMALSGAALVFFLLFHGCMNLALVFSEEAYNAICRFLGANWYAVIGSLGIAFLVLVHFCYGLYLTIQNRAARGNDRYAVTDKKKGVTWESENMLVLGFMFPLLAPLQFLVQDAVCGAYRHRDRRVRSSERSCLRQSALH